MEIIERKVTLIISGMDEDTTKEEIIEANKKIGSDQTEKLSIKTLYANRSGDQVSTIETAKQWGIKLVESPTFCIGSTWRIKEKVNIVRCTNCLGVGHAARFCKKKTNARQKLPEMHSRGLHYQRL